MSETVSLKEVLRKAIEEDDKRVVTTASATTEAITVGSNTPDPITHHKIVEASAPEEMSFVEKAGQLIPWEGK